MATYIALLRGINVSGQKKIRMADLKKHLEELNFKDIRTYIQSGNIIFDYKKTSESTLEDKISSIIYGKHRFKVKTFVTTPNRLRSIIHENPYTKDQGKNKERIYFTFLSEKPNEATLTELSKKNFNPEEFSINGRIIYLYSPNGYGRAKLNNNYLETQLKVSGTTRNLKTVKKLLELSTNT